MSPTQNLLKMRRDTAPSLRRVSARANRRAVKRIRLAVLLACFNRRETTLQCLNSLFAQDNEPFCDIEVFVLDDASSDGTSQAIAERFPSVHLLGGTGSLFWTGGMHKAFEAALKQQFDFYLWLNDDTTLFEWALQRMFETAEELRGHGIEAIVVGNTRSPHSPEHTYGGISM